MSLTRIAVVALLGIVLVSTIACEPASYHLYTSVSGQGSITPNSGTFLEGEVFTLIATPESGWEFDHWEGDLSGNGSLITITMDENKTIVAYFKQVEVPSTPGFETYTDHTNGFSLSIPDSWEKAPEEGFWACFHAPSPCAGYYPSGGVHTSSETQYSSVQPYYSDVIQPYIEALDEYSLISKEDLTIDDFPAIKVIYTYVDDRGHHIQEMWCFLIKQQTVWIVGGQCAPICWDTYEDTFNTMISSFRMLD